jgi:predicted thioesterase
MNNKNPQGLLGEVRVAVEETHTIVFPESGVPAVLSTPSLIWHMEMAAIEAVKPLLDPGEISVGVKVDIQHLSPTPVGMRVKCTARLLQIDGSLLSFGVEAYDDCEIIGRGFHQRKIVPAAAIARRIMKKKT